MSGAGGQAFSTGPAVRTTQAPHSPCTDIGAVAESDSGSLASFAFIVNCVQKTPLTCPSEAWEYAPAAGLTNYEAGAPDVRTISDEGTIPWPAGVARSGGAASMQIAEIEISEGCMQPGREW